MKLPKKTNKILFTIIMAIIFVIVTESIVWGRVGLFLFDNIANYPQGNNVIAEAVLVSLILIILLLFKNSYVFTQKREKLGVGLFYGIFFIAFSLFYIYIFGVQTGAFKYYHSLINLIFYCGLIGIAEEFLCRGWLLNEFLERFGNTKKGVLYSIIVSGLLFGFMHMGNLLAGQSVAITLTQSFNALAIGISFGVIYYKTKNIWSVIILHGLWDFSLSLPEIIPASSSTVITMSTSVMTVLFAILMALSQIIIVYPLVKDLDKKPAKSDVVAFSFIAGILYAIFSVFNIASSKTLGETYEYDKIKLDNYSVTNYVYKDYTITNNDVSLKLKEDGDKLVLLNTNTNYEVVLSEKNSYDYAIIDDKEQYILGYVDYVDDLNIYLNYTYIVKDAISNTNEYLDSIKNNSQKCLIPDFMSIISINSNDKTYLTVYSKDNGYYLLTGEEKLSYLEKE